MVPGAWLAFASAVFAMSALATAFVIYRILPARIYSRAYWHADLAHTVSSIARDGFALAACIALLWHFWGTVYA